ncbi:CDP-glycerol glycerophosphotransferase family protein [Pseudolysinimonas sp.]|uniref:CDP-glycerol glycerophosphotransferase family protein n=1 Tax=Pseudolysinimonas sp. TaxID=2680009 RepID=UPI003F7E621C
MIPPQLTRLGRRARRLPSRVARAIESELRAAARRRPVLDEVVLYESFAGNGALDNPEAIFRALLEAPDQAHRRHVWVLGRGHRAFRDEFRRDPRVRFVRPGTGAYWRAVSRAGVLINNATFPPGFDKRPGQTYVNTWHGTPLKHMGYDMPDGAMQSSNVQRNLLQADVLLSQSAWMTERMYLDAYKLRGLFRGRILEVGYPRVDRQELTAEEADTVLDALRVGHPRRRLVVYAPTWTGERFGAPRDEADAMLATVSGLQERLGTGFRVVLKAHQSVQHLLAGRPGTRDVLVSNDVPTNLVLGVADHLVTDFSSIFFDFLARDRPISFYVPDAGAYREERGAYMTEDELPGPVLRDLDALAARIAADDAADAFRDRRREWAERFTLRSDGHASERVIDDVLRDHRVRAAATGDDRRRVLLYLGGMRSNGITSSALALLRTLDHDRLDVSVLIARPASRDQRANQERIDPRVRQFIRQGGMTASKLRMLRLRLRERLRPDAGETENQRRLYADEWHRVFGDARFDAIVDFSGYSRFWSQILLHSPDARRTVWQHNDMAAEEHRSLGGGRRMRLAAMFALYPRFDALVSVSPTLAEVNHAAFGDRPGLERTPFLSARNPLDLDRIRAGASAPLDEGLELPVLDERGVTRFVSVGRLSPEKNQRRLLRAFAAVHRDAPATRLVLVGGGPLRAELEREIARLGIVDAVTLTGPVENPFAVMSACDCFVLSSDYEGQPMVLLEAAVLGLPIVSTRFGSVRDALPPEALTVVDPTPEALADGMRAYLDGRVPPAAIDIEAYGRATAREAEAAILGVDAGSSPRASSSSVSASASTEIAARAATASTTTPATMPMIRPMTSSDRFRPTKDPHADHRTL